VIILSNDDGKKMVERDGLDSFLAEYVYVTGVDITLIAPGERPDFLCEKRGQRYGLEVVRAMRNPVDRSWDVVMGRDDHLHCARDALPEGRETSITGLALPEVHDSRDSADWKRRRRKWRNTSRIS
jgi:hypothetical protein